MTPAAPSGTRRLALGVLLLNLWASVAAAQTIELTATPAGALALGDTVDVDIHLRTEGRRLTSAGLALAFDADILQALPATILEDGVLRPFATDMSPFAGSIVYENWVQGEPGGVGHQQARLVVVSGVSAGDARPTASGDGILARVRFRVVGTQDSTAVELVRGGRDRPVYTELGRPGVENDFAIGVARWVWPLVADGFLPLADVDIEAGRVRAVGLVARARETLTWTAQSSDGDRVEAWVEGDSLLLATRPRNPGMVEIEYRATDPAGVIVGEGRISVRVRAAPERLVAAPVSLSEDTPLLLPLARFVAAGIEWSPAWSWEVGVEPPLSGQLTAAGLSLGAPPDWHGSAGLTLAIVAGRERLDTVVVPVHVAPVNDAPAIMAPAEPLAAIVGVRRAAAYVSDLVADVDDESGALTVTASGDGGVEAWVESGRLQVRGLRAGPSQVTLLVVDGSGALAQAELPVEVRVPSAAPAFLDMPELQLTAQQSFGLALSEVVVDADTPTPQLTLVLEAGGAVAAVVQDADSLRVTAGDRGAGWVRLRAADAEGNEAIAAWVVTVTAPSVDAIPEEATEPPAGSPEEGPSTELPPSTGPPEVADDVVSTDAPRFTALPRVDLVLGASMEMDLSTYVDGAEGVRGYAISGARLVEAELDEESGHLWLRAPVDGQGRDILLLTAVDGEGQQATASLTIVVTAPTVTALRLQPIQTLTVVAGDTLRVDLAAFGEAADRPLEWSVVVSSDLLHTAIAGQVLTVRATGEISGQTSLLLAAEDDMGRRAVELVTVRVEGLQATEGVAMRLLPPPDVVLAAGDTIHVDLAQLVIAAAPVRWNAIDAAGMHLQIDASELLGGSELRLWAAATTPSGWRDVVLQATAGDAALTLRLRVAVAPSPALVLRQAPELEVAAGTSGQSVDLDGLVAVGVADDVAWSLVRGGIRVQARVTERHLVIDGSAGLPGREVFTLAATLAGEMRQVSVVVLVRDPVIEVSPPTVVASVGDTSLAVDAWIGGELAAAQLSWTIAAAPAGVAAVWDLESRRLRLAGSGRGEVSMTARLASGLRVAQIRIPVDLGAPQTPPREPVDEPSPPLPEPPAEAWSLSPTLLEPKAAGTEVRLDLQTLVLGRDPAQLSWQVEGIGGAARIDAGQLVARGDSTFHVRLVARAADGSVREATLTVPVLPPPSPPSPPSPPPRLSLALRLENRALHIETVADVADVALFVNGTAVDATPARVPLAQGPQRLEIVAEARRADQLARRSLTAAVGVFGAAGGRLVSPDGRLVVDVPAGLDGPTAVLIGDVDGSYRVACTGSCASLGLWFADAGGHAWAGVEELVGGRWRSVPGARRTASPAGVQAFGAPGTEDAVYRAVAAPSGVTSSAPQPVVVAAFPNPFNAAVTLQVDLAAGQTASVDIFDVGGRRLRRLLLRGRGPSSTVVWDGRDDRGRIVASGVYLYQLVGNGVAVKRGRVTLLR